jgi:hypothetical protein
MSGNEQACPICGSAATRKDGYDRGGGQRFRTIQQHPVDSSTEHQRAQRSTVPQRRWLVTPGGSRGRRPR